MFAYGPADTNASQNPHHLLPHLNPYQHTKVVLEKRPLNECCSIKYKNALKQFLEQPCSNKVQFGRRLVIEKISSIHWQTCSVVAAILVMKFNVAIGLQENDLSATAELWQTIQQRKEYNFREHTSKAYFIVSLHI